MNSTLIDALNEVDRNIGEQLKSTSTNISPTGTDLKVTNANENGYTSDIEIINDHDYVIRSTGVPSAKISSSKSINWHSKNLSVTCASSSHALTSSGNITRDVYDLSDDTSDCREASPAKRSRGRGSGRHNEGQWRGQLVDRLQSHSNGQENNQHQKRQIVPMKGNTVNHVNMNRTPQYKLTVSSSNSPDKKPRLQLIQIKATSSPASCSKKLPKCTSTSPPKGGNEVKEVAAAEIVSLAPDMNSACTKPVTPSPAVVKEAEEILCPNCGTWSSTVKHCSSCDIDFSQQLPRKYRSKSGHMGVCTGHTSLAQDTTASATCTSLPLIYIVSKTDPEQIAVCQQKIGNNTELKLTRHGASEPASTSKGLLATNMFYTSQIADGTSHIKPSMYAKNTPKAKRRQSRRKITEPVVISIDSDSGEDDSHSWSADMTDSLTEMTTKSASADTLHDSDEGINKLALSRKALMRDKSGNLMEYRHCKAPLRKDTCEESTTVCRSVMLKGPVVDLAAIMLRFGSLGIDEPSQVQFSSDCFHFFLGGIYPVSEIVLNIKDLLLCNYYLSSGMPTIFLETTCHFANTVRERLRMVQGQAFFDPGSKVSNTSRKKVPSTMDQPQCQPAVDAGLHVVSLVAEHCGGRHQRKVGSRTAFSCKVEAERRIIFRPAQDPLPVHTVSCLQSVFNQISVTRGLSKESLFIKLTKMAVNKVLGQCRPSRLDLDEEYKSRVSSQQLVDLAKPNIYVVKHSSSFTVNSANEGNDSTTSSVENKPAFYSIERSKAVTVTTDGLRDDNTSRNLPQPVVVLVYPPAPMKGGIILHEVDLKCLQEGEFLNDVIIDFYIKYLVNQVLSETDRQKTFVFSSFFYGRLMRREYSRDKSSRDAMLSRMEKRHHKVCTWTRNVDIFQKNFIIIPINEHSHWYVAIICYPGLVADHGILKECKNISRQNSPEATTSGISEQSIQERIDRQDVGGTGVDNPSTSTCLEISSSSSPFCFSEKESPNEEEPMEVDNNRGNTVTTHFVTDLPKSCSAGKNNNKQETTCEVKPQHGSSIDDEDLLYSQYQTVHCKRPCILIFDSLGGPSRRNVIQNLREYLTVEWQTRKSSKCVFDAKTIKGCQPKVPQQNNFSDCGIFLLQYVQMFFQKPINNLSIPIKGLDKWFQDATVNRKRSDIHCLIFELKKHQDSKKR